MQKHPWHVQQLLSKKKNVLEDSRWSQTATARGRAQCVCLEQLWKPTKVCKPRALKTICTDVRPLYKEMTATLECAFLTFTFLGVRKTTESFKMDFFLKHAVSVKLTFHQLNNRTWVQRQYAWYRTLCKLWGFLSSWKKVHGDASLQNILKQPSLLLLLWLSAQTLGLFLLKSCISDSWKIHGLINDSWIEVYLSFLGGKCFRVRRKFVIQLKEKRFLNYRNAKKTSRKMDQRVLQSI